MARVTTRAPCRVAGKELFVRLCVLNFFIYRPIIYACCTQYHMKYNIQNDKTNRESHKLKGQTTRIEATKELRHQSFRC